MLKYRGREVLRFVDDQHDAPAVGMAFQQVPVEGVHVILDAVRGTGFPLDRHRVHDRIDPGLREVATEGEKYDLATYLDAVKARALLGQKMKEFHCRYDLLLTPSLPITAFAVGTEVADAAHQEWWFDWTPFSYPFNLTQQPAASMPCGLTGDGLPVGVQLVGPMHSEGRVLRACRAYESRHPISLPKV